MVRPMPVSPTNMWCASSVSMKRQVRESGSKPDCARLSSCILPSRSVKKVNMWKDSQSGVASLKAPSMRGLSASPERRCSSSLGLLAAVAAEIFLQDVDHRPEVAAFLDVDLEHVAHVVERGRGLAEMALLLDRRRLGVALDDDQAAEHGAVFARHLLPDRLAHMAGRRESCGRPPAAPAGCPSDIRASSRSRTWPSPWDRPTPRCADRPAPPGSLPAPWSSTSRYSRDASPRARAARRGPR